MSDRAKNMLVIIGEHFLFVVMAFLLVSTFEALLKNHMYIISIATALLYVSSTYSAGWNTSKKDLGIAKEKLRKNNGEGSLDYRIYDGFIIALPALVISLSLFVLYRFSGGLWEFFFRVYNYSFLFVISKGDYPDVEIMPFLAFVASVLPYAAYSLGYVLGKSRKVLFIKYIPKIIFKSKNKE